MDFERPEDLYPLSPLQQGMLFQTLQMPGSGVCFEQDIYAIRGNLDVLRFKRAWEQVLARHSTLRTTFLWEEIDEPLQIVHRQGTLDLCVDDWRGISAEEQKQRLSKYMAAERERGFDLTVLPLMRIGLFRLAEDRHQFVWNFHHAVLDGWSLPLLIKEVLVIYEAERRGTPVHLPAPPLYRDFVAWLQQQDLALAEAYWRRTLGGFTAQSSLTIDRRAPLDSVATDDTFQRVLRRIPASATEALNSFARAHHLTLSTLVQGAWALLLGRYSGAGEVVFGCNVSGRSPSFAGVESMVGLFINTLPLRVQVAPGTPLLPWLKSLQDQGIEMREYEFSPLVQVQKWSQIPGARSLFESIVVFENYPSVTGCGADQTLEVTYEPWTRHSKTGYPLTLLALPGYQLSLEVKFDTRRFDRSTIERMLGHVETLLGGMAVDPNCPINELALLDERERVEIIEGFNRALAPALGSRLPLDGGATLHGLFEAQVARRPEAIALTCEGQSVTYAQVNAQANRLARHLVRYGVKPDTLVGLCLERSNELVIALLAILKAGGAYLPIDLAYPADRLTFMLEDAQAPVLLTQSKLTAGLPATKAKVLCVDKVLADPARAEEETNLPQAPGPDHLAYVIYTSGTTGTPKGSLITHRNAVRLFPATEHWYGFTERDVWTLFHSCAFDFSVWEIWGALLYGGRLVVVPFMVSRSPEAFYELLANEQVTVLNQTPSAFRQLIQAEEAVGQRELALRYVIFGGEALEMQSLRPWFERHGDRKPRLVNMYGITETTVHVTYRPLSRDDLDSGSVIGVPIPDLQIYILDAQRQPVPIGVPGEMYVGGAGLAKGYLRRPELTAERFIPNHLTGRPESRLYKTGDLARLLPGRDIEYLGRIDDQVKIRGFRIELGEIESVLCLHPSVREVAVIARDDVPGTKRLVAYLVASAPAEVSALREHLKKKLPEYMVPAAFVFLDKLPLTTNGKIDRKRLPAPEHRPELSNSYVAPRTPPEEKLVAVWSKVLRLPRVGVNDNFFELGGDSILSIQVISLARREGLKLTPKLLFAHQTIAELATVAEAVGDRQPAAEVVAGDVSLTPIQQWFFEQNLDELQHYNQAFLFQVAEKLDRSLLEGALKAVSRQHDNLRLRYARVADGWRQFYSSSEEPAHLSWTSIAQLSEMETVAAATQAGLNMENGPLWRAAYFDLGSSQPGRLLFVVHHLVVDGISWRPLLEDLETAYQQLQAGQAVQLPPKTTSFKVWSDRLREIATAESLRNELPHWQAVTEPLETYNPSVENTEGSASTLKMSLSADETQALLQQVPAVYNTQINDVLLTALAQGWRQWTGSRVLFTNLEGHGRESLFEDVDLSRTVGWFTSIFPVRLELPETGNKWQPGDALKAMKEQLRRIPQHGVSYGILRYLSPDTGLSTRAEPPMVFNYLGQFDQVLAGSKLFRFAPESTGPWHSPRQRRRCALETNCLVINGRLEVSWTYGQNLHTEPAIRQLANAFLAALRDLIVHCQSADAGGRTPSDFPLARLDQPTLDGLVGRWRDIEDVYPLSPIQTLFYSANPSSVQTAFDQWHCSLLGELDVSAFQRAWRETLQRHTILRSTIHGEGLREPVQIVHQDVRLPWTIEDWRSSPSDQRTERWSAFLAQDRAQPLTLTEVPAMRFALVRLTDQIWKFLWSVPALLLDGWSWPVVFRDVSRLYETYSQNMSPQLERVRPYRDYLEWLSEQSSGDAQEFWRKSLAGFHEPTPLPGEAPDADSSGERYLEHAVQLSDATTDGLQFAARRLQLTLNTLVQGAWALLLNRQSGAADVVFGAAFAGRPADLHGVESIVGPFVNNLPVRVTVDGDATAGEFFRQLHAHLLELSPFQFTPLMDIQQCSEVPWRHRLFDSLIVFQNYLVDESARNLGGKIEISEFAGPVHTNYPVMLLVEPGAALRLTLIYDRQRVALTTMEQWGRDLAMLLERLPAVLDKRVAGLQALLSPPAAAGSRTKPKLRVHSQNFVPPQTEMERTIAGVWQNMFGLEQVSIEENIFDLGGNSLLLVQVHSRLRETLKVEFSIVTLFEHPTVSSLARHLGQPVNSAPKSGQQLRDRAQQQKQALAQMRIALKK